MTIQEMHYHIDQGLQKNASFVYSNFLPEEIDAFINKMVMRFIKDRFDRSDPQELGFEKIQKRLDDIRILIAEASVSSLSTDPLPTLEDDYMFYISGKYVAGYDPCKKIADASMDFDVPLRLEPLDLLYRILKDPYRKPNVENSYIITIQQNTFTIYDDKKYILKGVYYNYIRHPEKVVLSSSTDCELAQHTHDEIVDLTVEHILEVIASPRYQTNSAQTSKTE